jgi:hypothetical protein
MIVGSAERSHCSTPRQESEIRPEAGRFLDHPSAAKFLRLLSEMQDPQLLRWLRFCSTHLQRIAPVAKSLEGKLH